MNKVWVWVGFPMGIGILLLVLVVLGSGSGASERIQYKMVATGDGQQAKLGIIDKKVGEGAAARIGNAAFVYYTGKLKNGQEFDTNKKGKGRPMEVKIGKGEVVPGFEEGLVGMKVGGIREIIIPPELGYGPQGIPKVIPPNAELRFEVHLVRLQ